LGEGEFRGPYLSCEPDIRVYDIKEHDKHLVIASDGLWDYLTKWEILKYVIEAKQSQQVKSSPDERETESETEDENEPRPTMAAHFLVEKILEKVSNDFDLDINYVKSL
jgi:serine/threonine protein phosphatase PrpC